MLRDLAGGVRLATLGQTAGIVTLEPPLPFIFGLGPRPDVLQRRSPSRFAYKLLAVAWPDTCMSREKDGAHGIGRRSE